MAESDMKVLLISRYFFPEIGGSCVVYDALCRHLSPQVGVLAGFADRRSAEKWDTGQPYRIYRSRALAAPGWSAGRNPFLQLLRSAEVYGWKRCGVLAATWKAVRRTSAELACIGSLGLYWLAAPLQRMRQVPVVFYIHGEELTSPDTSRLLGTGNFRALRKADGVVAVSRFTRAKLIDLGVEADRIALIPNGVDLERFTPGETDADLLDRYGLRGKRVLLTVGRLEERKGHATALRALPRILQACPDIVYVIVGSGEGLPDLGLEAMARDLGVAQHVVFAGPAPPERLPGFYRSCDLFVMPNHALPNGDTEGFGLVFLEAAACGKPVVGGRDGGVPDAVVDGETGLLVDGASADEFAEAVVRVLSDPDLAARLGRNGIEHARTMTWEGAAKAFEEFCRAAIARRGSLNNPRPQRADGRS
jgi:phosphatidylinositol alpha-1,6-mannosyltransferase